MEELLVFLNRIASKERWPLSTACIKHLRKIIKFGELREEEFLLSEGEVCKNLYFIRRGLLKCFYIVHDREVSDWFFGELESVVSIDGFYDQVLTVDERYLFFLKSRPDLIKRVPVRDMASYLDMSREELSRVRGRIH